MTHKKPHDSLSFSDTVTGLKAWAGLLDGPPSMLLGADLIQPIGSQFIDSREAPASPQNVPQCPRNDRWRVEVPPLVSATRFMFKTTHRRQTSLLGPRQLHMVGASLSVGRYCGRHGTRSSLRTNVLSDVLHQVLDGRDLTSALLARWVAAFVEDRTQLLGPGSRRLK